MQLAGRRQGARPAQSQESHGLIRGIVAQIARWGYAAKGIIYALIGLMGLLVAVDGRPRPVGWHGALATIGSLPHGRLLLSLLVSGFIAHAVWRLIQAAADTEHKGASTRGLASRAVYALVAVVYLCLAWSTVRFLLGAPSPSGDERAKVITATLLTEPMGRVLVGVVGLALMVAAVVQACYTFGPRFRNGVKLERLSATARRLVMWLGQGGRIALSAIYLVLGGCLIQAGLNRDPGQARGLAGALLALRHGSIARWFLAALAIGLIAHAMHLFLLAVFRKIPVP